MGRIAAKGRAAFAVEETRLARGAAVGDDSAFSSLYESYEGRAYNLAFRIAGSEADAADATQEAFLRAMRRLPELQDRELAFGPCLFTATRNACHDLIEKRRPAERSGAMREGGPDRQPPLDPLQEEVRDANMRLPEHQREALALRELEQLSYEEIGAIMETNRNSVAQLISRARINLRDELRGSALATVAAPSRDCERALPLIAAREDGQLEVGSEEGAWLDAHLAGCERCRLGMEEMRQAGGAYRAWEPIAVVPWLFEETMAKAATLAGGEWREADEERQDRSPRRRRATAVAGLAALLLGGGIATVLAGGDPSPSPDRPVAETHPARNAPASSHGSKRQKGKRGPGKARGEETAAAITASSPLTEAAAGDPAESPAGQQGTVGLQPPHATATPKPKSKSKPELTQQPAPATSPPAEAQPPTEPPSEETPGEHPSKGKGPPPGVPRSGPK